MYEPKKKQKAMNLLDDPAETENGMYLSALADEPGEAEAAMYLNSLIDDPEELNEDAVELIHTVEKINDQKSWFST